MNSKPTWERPPVLDWWIQDGSFIFSFFKGKKVVSKICLSTRKAEQGWSVCLQGSSMSLTYRYLANKLMHVSSYSNNTVGNNNSHCCKKTNCLWLNMLKWVQIIKCRFAPEEGRLLRWKLERKRSGCNLCLWVLGGQCDKLSIVLCVTVSCDNSTMFSCHFHNFSWLKWHTSNPG